MTTATTDERQQLVDEYLTNWRERGHVETDEARMQAAAYADRVIGNREYEAQRIEAAQQQLARQAQAQRPAGPDRRAIFEANRQRAGDNEDGDRWAKQVAANVARHEDKAEQARQQRTADERLATGRRERASQQAALRAELAARAGSNHYRAIVEQARLLRQTLNDLDAELFREALRPAPQDAPQGSGDDRVASARGVRQRRGVQ